jgi:hypothetical protein
MSVPLVSVQTMSVSKDRSNQITARYQVATDWEDRTLLLLISFIFSNARIQQTAPLLIFRLDVYSRDILITP